MVTLRLLFLTLVAAFGQEAPKPTTGTVSGVVRDAVTHTALPDVRVQMGERRANSDADGRFTFRDVPFGWHRIHAFDERHAGSGTGFVLLRPDEEPRPAEILIAVGGTISGRVTDEEQRPVGGASVILLEEIFQAGETVYAPAGTTVTGPNGEYRLGRVRPGHEYRVMAKQPLRVHGRGERRSRVLVPVWYPNAANAADAATATLASSEQRAGVDIQLKAGPSFCISGSAHAADGSVPGSVTVREHLAFAGGWLAAPALAKTDAEGNFEACGLHPGEYGLGIPKREVSAIGWETDIAYATIVDRDLPDVTFAGRSPVSIPGETRWDPAPPTPADNAEITFNLLKAVNLASRYAEEEQPPQDGGGVLAMGPQIHVPGAFTLDNYPPDQFKWKLGSLPEGCYIKRADCGGASILDRPLDLSRASADDQIRFAIACDGGSLTARVNDAHGAVVSGVRLYAVRAGLESAAMLQQWLKQALVEKGFSSALRALPPGKYLALATGLEIDGTAATVRKLWRALSKAKEVTVDPRAAAQIDLQLTIIE